MRSSRLRFQRFDSAAQFLAESVILGCLGGSAGLVIGAGVTVIAAGIRHWRVLIPAYGLWGGLAVAIVVAAVAGLYPAARAARLPPAEALRSGD